MTCEAQRLARILSGPEATPYTTVGAIAEANGEQLWVLHLANHAEGRLQGLLWMRCVNAVMQHLQLQYMFSEANMLTFLMFSNLPTQSFFRQSECSPDPSVLRAELHLF